MITTVRERLARLPRVRLAHLPTPLDACPRLSAAEGPAISVKRDDCTGLAFGGNKVRQHEYVLGDAIAQGADCVIQGSASQSNHSRQLAAAGAKLGLEVFLLPKRDAMSAPVQGNHLVSHLLGATITPIDPAESSTRRKDELAARLRERGRRPYVVGMGATRSLTLAALAYVEALVEIVEAGEAPDWIFVTSQGSTQAGLQLGCELLGLPTRVVGVNPMTAAHEAYLPPAQIAALARGAAELLGLASAIEPADVVNLTGYVGEGYGVPSAESLAAIATLGAAEGILLDPVYSGKGFAGLLDHCSRGLLAPGERVVFVHTGGLPALFGYADALTPQP
ncbi:D-cysteine desulfhydrase family protein [Nonomuraea sp. NPDC050540]|uniref:D-cysteine desulfhydrase family protein n=1 Tax=Nonomuraea sp. NPDC050540 TaxID=3364367 RepID=UPI0037A471F2